MRSMAVFVIVVVAPKGFPNSSATLEFRLLTMRSEHNAQKEVLHGR
jgi:hypothetical protein